MSHDSVLRSAFGLDANDALPLDQLRFARFTLRDSGWDALPHISHRTQERIDALLRTDPGVPSHVRSALAQHIASLCPDRQSAHEIWIATRDEVLAEIGGEFGGDFGNRISDALGYYDCLQGECIDVIDDPAHLLDAVASAPAGTVPRDAHNRPIFFIRKDEEQGATPYGDVAFHWPLADPDANDCAQRDAADRQFRINASVFGISPDRMKRELQETAADLAAALADRGPKKIKGPLALDLHLVS